jgi:hypothetical protein
LQVLFLIFSLSKANDLRDLENSKNPIFQYQKRSILDSESLKNSFQDLKQSDEIFNTDY